MKKILSIFSISLILFSCSKQFEGLTNFKISYSNEAVIQSSTGINLPFNIATPPTETNSEQKFKNENTTKDFIKEIFIESIKVQITDPNSADFSFLEEITIYINADGLEEKSIAWKNPVAGNGSKTLILDVSGDDLQEYIKKDAFTFRINAITDEIITQDYTLKISTECKVSAKLIK
jgi:hypothetical protein